MRHQFFPRPPGGDRRPAPRGGGEDVAHAHCGRRAAFARPACVTSGARGPGRPGRDCGSVVRASPDERLPPPRGAPPRAPPRGRPVSAREPARVPCGPGRGTPEREGRPEVGELRAERPRGWPHPGTGRLSRSARALSPLPVWATRALRHGGDSGPRARILVRWAEGLCTRPADSPAQNTPAGKSPP